jgi:hypothetical protein
LLAPALSLSCGSSDGSNVLGTIDASSGAGGATGGGGSIGLAGSIVVGPSDGGIVGVDGIVGSVGGGSLEDAACASESHQGQQVPLDLYMMLDSSGSMTETLSDNVTTKWDAVRAALRSFLNDPASSGLGVGLQYFPLVQPNARETCDPTTQTTDCGQFGPCDVINTCTTATVNCRRDSDCTAPSTCDLTSRTCTSPVIRCQTAAECQSGQQCIRLGVCNVSGGLCIPVGVQCGAAIQDICVPIAGNCRNRDICTSANYATPAVEVAPLPGAAASLIASLNLHDPTGLTPTAGALSGALSHAATLAAANPMHRVVVVLATDGFPTECTPVDIPGVANLASMAAARSPSILTFVIGVFAQAETADAQMNLDALARAGGTNAAFVINTGQNVTAAFQSALNSIRTTALACEYGIPQPEAGRLDYGKVNVQFTSGSGQKTTIGYVGSAAACAAQGGWYYDSDPASGGTPTKIVVCDSTCTNFKADPNGSVRILLGCTTQAIIR